MPMNEIIVRFDKMMGGNKKMEKREMQVRDSIPILEEAEAEKMISEEEIKRRALHAVEQEGTPSNPSPDPNPNPNPNPDPDPNPNPNPNPNPKPRRAATACR